MYTWLEINIDAIKNNISELVKKIPAKTKFMAVVKGNAYGHGLLDVAKNIANKVDYLAVYDVADALLLRKNKITTPILLLGRAFIGDLPLAIKNNIEITVTSLDLLEEIAKIKGNKKPLIHLCVDTGIGRDGFMMSEISRVIQIIKAKNIFVKGLYMHFSAADDKAFDDYSKKQLENFSKWQHALNEIGVNPITHTSASGGIMMSSFGKKFDMARSGISIYGLWPSDDVESRFKNKIKLQAALSFKTTIVEIKSMPKGACIAYNCTYKLKRDSKIAILPIGYFDGISRLASNKMEVLINGKKCKQLGRVMMNILVIDVTDVKNLKVGDIATIIGKDGKEIITAEELASNSQTINYEITTRLNANLARKYLPHKLLD
jgi:alanine racemase